MSGWGVGFKCARELPEDWEGIVSRQGYAGISAGIALNDAVRVRSGCDVEAGKLLLRLPLQGAASSSGTVISCMLSNQLDSSIIYDAYDKHVVGHCVATFHQRIKARPESLRPPQRVVRWTCS
jgi:hypothetical protein